MILPAGLVQTKTIIHLGVGEYNWILINLISAIIHYHVGE